MPQKMLNLLIAIAVIGTLFISFQAISQNKVLASSTEIGNPSENVLDTSNGRKESNCAKLPAPAPIDAYKQRMYDLIIGSTPFAGKTTEWGTISFPSTNLKYEVDKNGFLTNIRFLTISGSIATDFWTLYAVASCPPIKPPADAKTPMLMSLSYLRTPPVASSLAEECRAQLAQIITRKADATKISFPLIPASFIQAFPDAVQMNLIADKTNLVAIPVDKLLNGGQYWSVDSANMRLQTTGDITRLLAEWPAFFKSNQHPSTKEILLFAKELKEKYKQFLEKGEPVAPLP